MNNTWSIHYLVKVSCTLLHGVEHKSSGWLHQDLNSERFHANKAS